MTDTKARKGEKTPSPSPTGPALKTLDGAESAVREATRRLRLVQASISGAAASAALADWKVGPAEASAGAAMVGLKTDGAVRAAARIESLRMALASPAAQADPTYRAQVETRLARAVDGAPKRAVADAAAAILGGAIRHWIPLD